jgi:formyl-CoA transferase
VLLDADVVVDRDVERVTFPGIVPKLDQMPGEVRWLGPELGEHTAEVLAELLGVSDAELSDLRKRGVV